MKESSSKNISRNHLVLIKVEDSALQFRKHLSDLFTLRHGWWDPVFYVCDPMETLVKTDSLAGEWLNSRSKNAKLISDLELKPKDKPNLKWLLQKLSLEKVIYIRVSYSPRILIDDVMQEIERLLDKSPQSILFISDKSKNSPRNIGFMADLSYSNAIAHNTIPDFLEKTMHHSGEKILVDGSPYFAEHVLINDSQNKVKYTHHFDY